MDHGPSLRYLLANHLPVTRHRGRTLQRPGYRVKELIQEGLIDQVVDT